MDTEDALDPALGAAIDELHDQQPERDLWPGIANRLDRRHGKTPLVIRWPTALAAGLVIAIATSAGTALLMRHSVAPVATTAVAPSTATIITASFAPGDAALARAANDLELAVRNNLGHVDPEARASINKSLIALDSAIAQAARRQNASPGNERAAKYLTSTLRKKLQLLRTVSELTQQQS